MNHYGNLKKCQGLDWYLKQEEKQYVLLRTVGKRVNDTIQWLNCYPAGISSEPIGQRETYV